MQGLRILLLLSAAMLLMIVSVWAQAVKMMEVFPREDASPCVGPVVPYSPGSPVDNPWDVIWYNDVEATVVDIQLVGADFVADKWFVTGGNNGVNPNKLYILDRDGSLLSTIDQPTTSVWGWRDLAYDGTYLYAGDEGTVIHAFDTNGTLVPGMNIPRPAGITCTRGLTYDPATDHFYASNWGPATVEFTRTGAVVRTFNVLGGSAYGLAWDAAAPGGPFLWAFSQLPPSPATHRTKIYKVNPATGDTLEAHVLPLIGSSTGQLAGGLGLTNQWVPCLWTLLGMIQGTPHDMVFVQELRFVSDDAPAPPTSLTVSNNGAALLASLAWTNPTLTAGGSPLASIDSVVVERDGVFMRSWTSVTPGQNMNYDNIVPDEGMYTYGVYAVNSAGFGCSETESAWIGLDVPGGVASLVGTGGAVLLEADLTWVNPTAGANGGYWPVGTIDGYTINRYGASTATFNVSGIQTGFHDGTVPVEGWYQYGVIAYDASGDGPEVFSNWFPIGPHDFDLIAYNWVEINPGAPGGLPGTSTGITGDDQTLGPFPIGFNFLFYDCASFNQIYVCSNGWASFTSISTEWTNAAIPTATEPNNLLACYWDDLLPPGGGIWYYYDALNTRFIIEWYQIPHISGGSYTFEIILYPDGTVDYMYNTITHGLQNSCTTGIENSTGTVGVQCTYDGSGPLNPQSNMGIRIFTACPPPEVPVVVITLAAGTDDMAHAVLTWAAVAHANHYKIYRSTDPETGFVLLDTITGTQYTDTDAVLGQDIYFYYVTATNE